MNRVLRVGMVGLGNIAQKVYLPFLSHEQGWRLIGAYSPAKEKRDRICAAYRIQSFASYTDLLDACDVVFVHTSTATHYEVVLTALKKGKDVYVDKPLASTVAEAERLVESCNQLNRKCMVGFNRRFAPVYMRAKEMTAGKAWVRIEKHQMDHIDPVEAAVTMLDDYIHVVDLGRWFGAPDGPVIGRVKVNEKGQLVYAQHHYQSTDKASISLGMHRRAGTNLEQVEIMADGQLVRVKNMDQLEIERDGVLLAENAGNWDTVLKRRGFVGAILHFLGCVEADRRPQVDAEEALKTQQLLQSMIDRTDS